MSTNELKLKIEEEKTRREKVRRETARILESAAGKWAIIIGSFGFFLLFLALVLMNI